MLVMLALQLYVTQLTLTTKVICLQKYLSSHEKENLRRK
jgi:hypothetical protein